MKAWFLVGKLVFVYVENKAFFLLLMVYQLFIYNFCNFTHSKSISYIKIMIRELTLAILLNDTMILGPG